MEAIISQGDLDDRLCEYCPLEVKGTIGGPNGPISCEGSHCSYAYDTYVEETVSENVIEIIQRRHRLPYDQAVTYYQKTIKYGNYLTKREKEILRELDKES